MPDREKVIKGCENWVNNHKGEDLLLTYSSVVELLALLKEQEAVVRCKDCKYWKNGYLNYVVHEWLPCMEVKTTGDW